jgi:hypothetical protein
MFLNSVHLDHSLWSLLIRFFVNMVTLFILIRFIYFRFSRKANMLFSFFLMGIMIFLIVSLLETVEIQIGIALGLFAVFAILRFRTRNLPVKDMTYIFTVIGISVINSQAHIPPPVLGALIVNSIVLLTAFFLELFLLKRTWCSLNIIYNKPELLKPDHKMDLLNDLSGVTGQKIELIKIQRIDVSKGHAELVAYYKDKKTD